MGPESVRFVIAHPPEAVDRAAQESGVDPSFLTFEVDVPVHASAPELLTQSLTKPTPYGRLANRSLYIEGAASALGFRRTLSMETERREARLEPVLLRVPDAVRLTNLSRSLLYVEIQSGRLPVVRFGRAVRVRRDDLLRWIDSHAAS